jgi:uncharacterized protein YmfQ (DUF2313 family)
MPSPPQFGASDYRQALLNLLPRGRVWPREQDSVLSRVLGALAPTYERSTAAAAQMLVDSVPTTTSNLLAEWESSLGLPDGCGDPDQSIAERKATVAARWAARGGQAPDFYIKLGATLGYAITITEFSPSRFGRPFGQPFGGEAWANVWQVNAPTFTIRSFEFGSDAFGEPFRSWGNTALQCRLRAAAPAHTILLFFYS